LDATVGDIGEFRLIERLARILPRPPDAVEGIGDDCAVIRMNDRTMLIAADLSVENVHFRTSTLPAEAIGRRAAVSSLSDIAAMGGAPLYGLVSIACPASTDVAFIEDVYKGIGEAFSSCGAYVIGGDTTKSPNGIAIDVIVLGEASGERCLLRRGASQGDLLAVAGPLGLARAGLHALEHGHDAPALIEAHGHPRARLREGQWLCRSGAVHAMIDVSDGVIQDAGHMAEAAGLGINIRSGSLPIDPDLARYCAVHGLDATHMMLAGGEDYALARALDAAASDQVLAAFRDAFDAELTIIGEFTDEWPGVRVDGAKPHASGFDHFAC